MVLEGGGMEVLTGGGWGGVVEGRALVEGGWEMVRKGGSEEVAGSQSELPPKEANFFDLSPEDLPCSCLKRVSWHGTRVTALLRNWEQGRQIARHQPSYMGRAGPAP